MTLAKLPRTLLRLREPGDAGLVEALMRTAPSVPRSHLVRLVDGCRADLAGSPPGAMPELVDRLARQRLSTLLTHAVAG